MGFLKKSKAAQQKPAAEAPIDREAEAVQRIVARGERLKSLGAEASMWRSFATGCKAGRSIYEDPRYLSFISQEERGLSMLRASMDEDTALLWRDFAVRMAEDRERRLRDTLSGCA